MFILFNEKQETNETKAFNKEIKMQTKYRVDFCKMVSPFSFIIHRNTIKTKINVSNQRKM